MSDQELLLSAGVGDPQDTVAGGEEDSSGLYCAPRRQDQPA